VNTATSTNRLSTYLDERRERRRAARALRRDLSTYTTRADIDDLLAALDRHEGPQAQAIRSILNEQALRRQGVLSSIPLAS
jgi:hypothetical protein